jgi:hypothetical protein
LTFEERHLKRLTNAFIGCKVHGYYAAKEIKLKRIANAKRLANFPDCDAPEADLVDYRSIGNRAPKQDNRGRKKGLGY